MYRRLVWVLALLLLGGVALWAIAGQSPLHDAHLQALIARLQAAGWLRLRSNGGLLLLGLVQNLVGAGVVALLMWLGAFHPVRRSSAAVAALRYVALATACGYALFAGVDAVRANGALAALYSQQLNRGIILTMLGILPHKFFELLAFAFLLAAPLFVALRALRVMDVRQASFEGWLELRRHWRWVALLLLCASLVEVYVTPAVVASLLR